MTDFYTACRERENRIIQDTRKQLENYQVEAISRDGVYWHLVCYDPEKGSEYSFRVYTAPWIVTILGDRCSAYTLKCEHDMLTNFLNTDEPNIKYWAEKVQNRTNLKTTEYEFVLRYLFDYLNNWADHDMEPDTLNNLKREVAKMTDIDDPLFIDNLSDLSFGYLDRKGKPVHAQPFYNLDFEDVLWDIWTEEWIRVCELLRWTACKVREMEKLGK